MNIKRSDITKMRASCIPTIPVLVFESELEAWQCLSSIGLLTCGPTLMPDGMYYVLVADGGGV